MCCKRTNKLEGGINKRILPANIIILFLGTTFTYYYLIFYKGNALIN